ncbi:MAG: PQQ-binding-like beta-propeller repeat protein [Anaerolineae bacterium]|nr:PQQ-binding-like beta-propeller repeat protein [Anaerolineae bacterium]
MKSALLLFVILLCVAVFSSRESVSSQVDVAPCGYVDGFELPVPDIDIQRIDFGLYRAQFGGLHTGIDVAFEELGAPVRAAARGRVTYSDVAGWDTEKGVVVIQHTMPDGSLVNTLYGHMEELNGYTFPMLDQCVERGDIVGAVGFPSLGRPHLHYEIRTRYRYEGGPGYTQVNPIELGWLNPVDFTYLANVWVLPAYRHHFSLTESPTLPPLTLSNGTYALARSGHLEGVSADGDLLWEFDTLGGTTGLLALPDGRVLVTNSTQQVLVLANGSFSALWQLPQPVIMSPIQFGDAVVFVADDYRVLAFTPDGAPLWETPPLPDRVERWVVSGDRLAVATANGDLRVIDAAGQVMYQQTFAAIAVPFAAPGGEFLIANGTTISRLDRALTFTALFDTGHTFNANTELLYADSGTLYLYPGEGFALYAHTLDGALQWIAYMPGSYRHSPYLGIGGGRLLYVLSTDGQLLAYDTGDGRLIAQVPLYDGGVNGTASTRKLDVQSDDTVTFTGGYLTLVTLDGLALFENAP